MNNSLSVNHPGDMTQKPTISVVIPNLNGARYLQSCLSSLERQVFKDFEVIVVDNGSSDDSVSLIKKEFLWVKLKELPENIGFAAACNIGIKASGGKYVALLNNDTEVAPQWLEGLQAVIEKDEKIGMVASKILLSFETREIDSVGMLIYPDGIGRQRGRGEVDRGQFDHEEEVLFPSACAGLYKREMIEDIGLFDENFFAYGEDTDLGLRAGHGGWRAILAPGAEVYHKYSGTGGKYSSFKAFHVERNRIWVAVKDFPLAWLLGMPFYTLLRYAVQGYGSLTGRGVSARFKETLSLPDMALTIMRAYISSFKGLPLMLKKRREIKRRIDNKEFIAKLRRHQISVSELVLKD